MGNAPSVKKGNENLPAYLFNVCYNIPLHQGLIISAEEIVKDRRNSQSGSHFLISI